MVKQNKNKQKRARSNKTVPSKKIEKNGKIQKRGRPPISKKLNSEVPLINANMFTPLSDLDFCLYLQSIEQSKALGLSIIDGFGNFYFLNKTACEHFQASLNNLQGYSFFDLMVSNSRQRMIDILKSPIQKLTFQTTVYSKNNKRKWPKDEFSKSLSIKEVYYRYLKTILGRIQPITLTKQLSDKDFQNLFQDDFWIEQKNPLKFPMNLFLLQTRLSISMQNFDQKLFQDPVLQKFMQRDQQKNNRALKTSEKQKISKQQQSKSLIQY